MTVPEQDEQAGDAPRRLKVLIAEDHVDAARALGAMIAILGHTARVAHDGREALDALDEFEPDIGIFDLGMPYCDGLELARAVRAHERLHGIRLIALTAWGDADSRRATEQAGFDLHLQKPSSFEEIAKSIEPAVADGGADD
jgi:CheY-like chemotaxis protein